MKPIEETHPSLCEEWDTIGNHIGEYSFTKETIQKHTVDKQVLGRALAGFVANHESQIKGSPTLFYEKLVEELGL